MGGRGDDRLTGFSLSGVILDGGRGSGYVTDDLLQRSDHRSVQALEGDIRNWVKAWNNDPKPFVWTKTAEQILGSLGRLIQRISNPGH